MHPAMRRPYSSMMIRFCGCFGTMGIRAFWAIEVIAIAAWLLFPGFAYAEYLGDVKLKSTISTQNFSDNGVMVDAENNTSAYVDNSGNLWMWGGNSYGQVGNGATSDQSSPVRVLTDVVCVSVGSSFSAAVKSDGSLWAWGDNAYGQLGDGSKTSSTVPRRVMEGVKAVSASGHTIAVLKVDGSLWTWGQNYFGSLGNGESADCSTPTRILDDVMSMGNSGTPMAAIKKDGTLWTWGRNYKGCIGDGSTETRFAPVKVLDGVVSASFGMYSSAAVKEDGSLWTWGWNDVGQLGDGNTADRAYPQQIMTGVAGASMGTYFGAAVKTDGTLWTWGSSSQQRLGDGSIESRAAPAQISTGISSVALGYAHGLATREDGSLLAWGCNSNGQLGDASTLDSPGVIPVVAKTKVAAPVAVSGLEYTGISQVGVTSGAGYTLSGVTAAVDAGQYVAYAELTDSGTTQWQDGSSARKEIAWSISPRDINEVTAHVYEVHMNEDDLSGTTVLLDWGGVTYDGRRHAPDYAIALDEPLGLRALAGGEDYDCITDSDCDYTAAGKHNVYLIGRNNYKGTKAIEVIVNQADISQATVTGIASKIYDATPQTQDITVTLDGRNLLNGIDYDVVYDDNVSAGKAVAVVRGKGNYTGEISESFSIVPARLENAEVSLSPSSYAYDGAAKKPSVSVSLDGQILAEGADYSVSYVANTQVGTATAVVVGKGNYAGETRADFVILGASSHGGSPEGSARAVSGTSIAAASVKLSAGSYTYDGTAKRPGVTVVAAGRELRQGSDYAVSYAGNVNAGTAKVVVAGAGSYSGSLTKVFRIDRAKLAGGAVGLSSASYVYSGKARKPAVVVRVGGRVLRAGRDYAVSYPKGRAAVGSYAVRVQGKGNYSGSASASFSIVLKGTRIASLKWVADGSRSGFAARWGRQASQASGYELSWSLSGSFSGAKSCRYAAASKFARKCAVNKAVPKSWRGKRAYVRIRTYKTVGGRTYVSAWSKAKSVVVKK